MPVVVVVVGGGQVIVIVNEDGGSGDEELKRNFRIRVCMCVFVCVYAYIS